MRRVEVIGFLLFLRGKACRINADIMTELEEK